MPDTVEDLKRIRENFMKLQPASRKDPGLSFREFGMMCKLLGIKEDRHTLSVLFAGLEKDKVCVLAGRSAGGLSHAHWCTGMMLIWSQEGVRGRERARGGEGEEGRGR